MIERWYVLRSKPRKEAALASHARKQGLEVYLPTIPVKPVNPRASKTQPYFPGYLFVYTDLGAVGESTFRWMPMSQGLVQIGGEPANLEVSIVRAIQHREKEIWRAGGMEREGLRHGNRVIIREGSFAEYEGIFDTHLSGSARARIMLKMISDRYVPVEMDVGLVEKMTGEY